MLDKSYFKIDLNRTPKTPHFLWPNLGSLRGTTMQNATIDKAADIMKVALRDAAYASMTCSRYIGSRSAIARTDLRTCWMTYEACQ